MIIRVLSSSFSMEASRIDGLTGVWVGKYGFSVSFGCPYQSSMVLSKISEQNLRCYGFRESLVKL